MIKNRVIELKQAALVAQEAFRQVLEVLTGHPVLSDSVDIDLGEHSGTDDKPIRTLLIKGRVRVMNEIPTARLSLVSLTVPMNRTRYGWRMISGEKTNLQIGSELADEIDEYSMYTVNWGYPIEDWYCIPTVRIVPENSAMGWTGTDRLNRKEH